MDRRAWLFLWSAVGLLFVGFWTYGLFDLDEGIYAAALSEMARKNEWIVVTLRDQPFFEKPILIYWFGLAFTKAGLPGVLALRLPSVLATLGTLMTLAPFVRRHFGDKVAFGSVLLLSTSLLYMVLGRMFTPDAVLVFAMTAAFLSFWESLDGSKRWRLMTGFMLGIAALAKGPMPIVIFIVLFTYTAIRLVPDRKVLLGGWTAAFAVFLLTVAAWYVPVALREGTAFFGEFIVRQNLGRLGGGDKAHLGPFFFYLPIILVSFIPASVLLPQAWKSLRNRPVEKYLWAWILAVFVLFSAAGSKLPHYILPLLPPMAILLAAAAVDSRRGFEIAALVFSWLVLIVLGCATFLVGQSHELRLQALLVATAIGTAAGTWVFQRKGGALAQAGAFAYPFAAAALLIGVPAYWNYSHRDAATIGGYLAGVPQEVIEYRTGAEGKRGETAHPSILWQMGRIAKSVEEPGGLARIARPECLVLTRGRRVEEALSALEHVGLGLVEVRADGRFQVYRVVSIP